MATGRNKRINPASGEPDESGISPTNRGTDSDGGIVGSTEPSRNDSDDGIESDFDLDTDSSTVSGANVPSEYEQYEPDVSQSSPIRGEQLKFSVGAIFGSRNGSNDNGASNGRDHGDNRRAGASAGEVRESQTEKRTRKKARETLAEEYPKEEREQVSKPKSKTVGTKKLTQTEAAEVAEGLLDMAGFVVAKIVENDEAEFTDDEKDDILPGLTRIMLRMSPAAAKRYRDLTDPFMLVLAFYFYFARVAPMMQEKRWRDQVERARYAENTGFPSSDNPVSGVDNGQSKDDSNSVDRRGSIFR